MPRRDEHPMNIAEQLRALPSAAPVADGWTSVQQRVSGRRRAAARRATGLRIAAAASIALVALTATWRVNDVVREHPASMRAELTPLTAEQALAIDRVAQLRVQSNALEDMLAAIGERPVVERAGTSLPIDTLEAQVQWIDHQISIRDGEATPGPVEQLWRRRVEAMNSLVQLRYVEAQHIDM